jgi:hypothetical protein
VWKARPQIAQRHLVNDSHFAPYSSDTASLVRPHGLRMSRQSFGDAQPPNTLMLIADTASRKNVIT